MLARNTARISAAVVVVLTCTASMSRAQSVRGYIFRAKGYALWDGLTGNQNVIEQNEKPHGEIWTQISPMGQTYGRSGRTTLDVHNDPPPPSITLDHQLRMGLVIGDVIRQAPPARTKAGSGQPMQRDPWHGDPLIAGFVPLTEVVLYQGADLEDGSRVDEHWSPGQRWAYRLDLAEASWVATGTPTLVTTGDVVAELESFTASTITVRILSEPTTTTHDDISIRNVGMNVQGGVLEVHLQLGFQGTCDFTVNDQLLATTTTSQMRFHLTDVFSVAQFTPATRRWGLVVMALLLLGIAWAANRGWRASRVHL